MITLTPGHKYQLASLDGTNDQIVQFIQKEPVEPHSTTFKTVVDGTTNEEVLKMLIDRLLIMYNKMPSKETYAAINHLEQALYALQSRTYERMQRNVEGTGKA